MKWLGNRLGDEQSIERISVVEGQGCHHEGMFRADSELMEVVYLDLFEQFLRVGVNFSKAAFDGTSQMEAEETNTQSAPRISFRFRRESRSGW
jgi:hypothetical protein